MINEVLHSFLNVVAGEQKSTSPCAVLYIAREGYLKGIKSGMCVLGSVSVQSSLRRYCARNPKAMVPWYRCISVCSQGKLGTADFMMAL